MQGACVCVGGGGSLTTEAQTAKTQEKFGQTWPYPVFTSMQVVMLNLCASFHLHYSLVDEILENGEKQSNQSFPVEKNHLSTVLKPSHLV